MNKSTLVKALLFTAIGLWLSSYLFAEDAPVQKFYNTRIMAMGNVQSVNSSGYKSLFMNPAGIKKENGGDLLSAAAGPYINLSPEVLEEFQSSSGDASSYNNDPGSSFSTVEEAYEAGYEDGTADTGISLASIFNLSDLEKMLEYADYGNGIGGHLSFKSGGSYAGFGIGLNYNTDFLFMQDKENAPVDFRYTAESQILAGFSYGFEMGKDSIFYIGLSGGQLVQTVVEKTFAPDEIDAFLEGGDSFPNLLGTLGNGYPFNIGALYEAGPLTASLNIKNIGGTTLSRSNTNLGYSLQILEQFDDGSFDEGAVLFGHLIPQTNDDPDLETPEDVTIPMSASLGASINMDFGRIAEFTVSGEYEKVFYTEDVNSENDTIWKNIHIGGELGIWDALKLRTGINQGYFTSGFGLEIVSLLNLVDLNFNASYYSRELGSYAGHKQSEAVLVEVALSIYD